MSCSAARRRRRATAPPGRPRGSRARRARRRAEREPLDVGAVGAIGCCSGRRGCVRPRRGRRGRGPSRRALEWIVDCRRGRPRRLPVAASVRCRARKTPSRRPNSVASTASTPVMQDRLDRDGGREDDVGARGLDAADLPALGRGARRAPSTSHERRLARHPHSLDAEVRRAVAVLDGGREVAHRPADADEPVAEVGDPRRVGELRLDAAPQRAQRPARRGAVLVEEPLRRGGRRRASTSARRAGGGRGCARAAVSRRRCRGRRRWRGSSSSPPRGSRSRPPARGSGPAGAGRCSRVHPSSGPGCASRIALVATASIRAVGRSRSGRRSSHSC